MAIDLRQVAWRFGNDDGTTQANHTFRAAENAVSGLKLDTNYLLRIGIQEVGDAAANLAQQFQYSLNQADWVNITTTSNVARAVAVASYANNADSTTRLATLTGSPDASNVNCTEDGSSRGTQNDVPANGHSETVLGFQLRSADIAAGTTVYFRVTVSGPTTSITYTVTPSAVAWGNQTLAATEELTARAAPVYPIKLQASAETTARVSPLFRATLDATTIPFAQAIRTVWVICVAGLEYELVTLIPSETLEAEAASTADVHVNFQPVKLGATETAAAA